MHQPVHPVEIGIMHKQHNDKGAKKIGLAILLYIGVIKGMGPDAVIINNQHGHCSKNKNRQDGVADLAQVIIPLREFRLDLPALDPFTQQHISKHECEAGEDQVSQPDQFCNKKIRRPIHMLHIH